MENQNKNFLDDLICSSIEKIKELSSSNTIYGESVILPNGGFIIPISKISVGFVVGGGEYSNECKKMPYQTAGGSGGGISIVPVGFLTYINDEIKFVDIENKTCYQTILNLVNTLLEKVNSKNESVNNNEKV